MKKGFKISFEAFFHNSFFLYFLSDFYHSKNISYLASKINLGSLIFASDFRILVIELIDLLLNNKPNDLRSITFNQANSGLKLFCIKTGIKAC